MMRRPAGTMRIVPVVIATCRLWRRAIGFHRCRAEVWGKQRVGRAWSSRLLNQLRVLERPRGEDLGGPWGSMSHPAWCRRITRGASHPCWSELLWGGRRGVRGGAGRAARRQTRSGDRPRSAGPVPVYACLSLCAACPSARNVAKEEPAHPTRIIAIDTPSHPRCDLHRRWRTVSPKLLWLTRHRD